MESLRVERVESGSIESVRPRHDPREQPRQERQPDSNPHERERDLANILRRKHVIEDVGVETRTEFHRDDVTGDVLIRVRDARTNDIIAVLTPDQLADLSRDTGIQPGVLFETRT